MDIHIVRTNFKQADFFLQFKNKQSSWSGSQTAEQKQIPNVLNKTGSSVNIQWSLIHLHGAANCISMNEKPASIKYNTQNI